MKQKTKDNLLFGVNFLKNPLKNASVIPSSRFASRAMVSGIDFSKVDSIVELGPGTGVFTEEILRRCKPDTKVILIEIEKSYLKILGEKFSDKVILENTSAHLLDEILAKHGLAKADLIISGLPFIKDENGKELFRALKTHTDSGTIFRFFTYLPPVMKLIYRKIPVRKISFVPKNFPPLWVYGVN